MKIKYIKQARSAPTVQDIDAQVNAVIAKIKTGINEKPTALNSYGLKMWDSVRDDLVALATPPASPVQEPVAILKGIDEYGPVVDWYRHWVTVPIGTKFYTAPLAQPAPVREPEHLQQGVDALVSAAGTALEVLEKHRQIKGEAPMGMLGVRAIEELKEAFGLLHPQDDYEPPAQPAVPDV